MKIVIEELLSIAPAFRANSNAVKAECRMSEGQMFDALLGFLEHISDAQWEQWKRKIDADTVPPSRRLPK